MDFSSLHTSNTRITTTLLLGAAALVLVFLMLPTSAKSFIGNQIRRPFVSRKLFSAANNTGTAYTDTGMPILPNDVVKYSQVPGKDKVFTADKIPRGLLKEHTTKAGKFLEPKPLFLP